VTDTSLFQVGTIFGTHGLRGDLKVHTDTAGSEVLLGVSELLLHCADGQHLVVDVSKAWVHKQNILLHLRTYDHIDSVASLINAKIMLAYDRFPPLAEGDYYWHQLEGLQVVDSQCGVIGTLTAVVETGAHDIYVAQGLHGEVMFPAVDAFIDEIDLEAGHMLVTLPTGLVDLNG
jgi:16S rRNA processing protein RimM